jgi:hypothetical protein
LYGSVVAKGRACCAFGYAAALPAVSWVGDHGFAVLKVENAVGAKLNATRFSNFVASITFIRDDYWKARVICVRHFTHQQALRLFLFFSQFVDDFPHFFLRRMRYGARRAYVIATSAENHAVVWVLYN